MTQSPPETQYLLDRAAIHDVLVRYFQGIDLGNDHATQGADRSLVRNHDYGRPRQPEHRRHGTRVGRIGRQAIHIAAFHPNSRRSGA